MDFSVKSNLFPTSVLDSGKNSTEKSASKSENVSVPVKNVSMPLLDVFPVSLDSIKANYCPNISSTYDLSKIQDEINEKFIMKGNEDWTVERDVIIPHNNPEEFANDIFNIIKKYDINNPKEIHQILEKAANMPKEEIAKYSESFSIWGFRYAAQKKMEIKQEFLKEVQKSMSFRRKDEYLFPNDIKSLLDLSAETVNRKHNVEFLNRDVERRIKYEPDNVLPDEKVELNDEEMKELKKLARTEEELPYEKLCQRAMNYYVGGDYSLMYASEKIQKAVLNNCPRYNSKNRKHYSDGLNNFENHPVVRWLQIVENSDEFVQNFKEGDTYKYKYLQSCSKDGTYCENEFRDDTIEKNVKFIIHPKSETSKARDLGDRKYGGLEVIYPANQEFVILDKALVKYHDGKNDFYRWVIHMQEK